MVTFGEWAIGVAACSSFVATVLGAGGDIFALALFFFVIPFLISVPLDAHLVTSLVVAQGFLPRVFGGLLHLCEQVAHRLSPLGLVPADADRGEIANQVGSTYPVACAGVPGKPHGEVPVEQALFRAAPLRTTRASFNARGSPVIYAVLAAGCSSWMAS